MLRIAAFIAAGALLVASVILGTIAVVAVRRSEGVFLPAGYVALICLAGAGLMIRVAVRW